LGSGDQKNMHFLPYLKKEEV